MGRGGASVTWRGSSQERELQENLSKNIDKTILIVSFLTQLISPHHHHVAVMKNIYQHGID